MIDELISRISVNAQSSICIDAEPKIYFDPFRIEKAHHDADLIFFTHPHHDHFSSEDFRKVAKPDTAYIAPAVMHNDLEEAGIPMKPWSRLANHSANHWYPYETPWRD